MQLHDLQKLSISFNCLRNLENLNLLSIVLRSFNGKEKNVVLRDVSKSLSKLFGLKLVNFLT